MVTRSARDTHPAGQEWQLSPWACLVSDQPQRGGPRPNSHCTLSRPIFYNWIHMDTDTNSPIHAGAKSTLSYSPTQRAITHTHTHASTRPGLAGHRGTTSREPGSSPTPGESQAQASAPLSQPPIQRGRPGPRTGRLQSAVTCGQITHGHPCSDPPPHRICRTPGHTHAGPGLPRRLHSKPDDSSLVGHPVHCRVLSSTPSHHPLDANSSPNPHWLQPKMPPDTVGCPPGGKTHPHP